MEKDEYLFSSEEKLFIEIIINYAKDVLDKTECLIFLCNRNTAKVNEISFDKFNPEWKKISNFKIKWNDNRQLEYSEEEEKHKDKEKHKMYEIIKDCYLKNEDNSFKSNFIVPIPSKIGCLGVVVFSKSTDKNHKKGKLGNDMSATERQNVRQPMSALGDALLMKLSCFKNPHLTLTEKIAKRFNQDFNLELDTVHDKFWKYIPFAKRDCVTMFIDIRNFSVFQDELSSYRNDKCEHVKFYIEVSQTIAEVATSHFGIVNGFWGGSALLIFNALLYETLETACRRALCATKHIIEEMNKIFDLFKKETMSADIRLGIGGNAGEVFFFGFGSNKGSYSYNAMGKVVSETKKIERFSDINILENDQDHHDMTPCEEHDHVILSKEFHEAIKNDKLVGEKVVSMNSLKNRCKDDLWGFKKGNLLETCENFIECNNCCLQQKNGGA